MCDAPSRTRDYRGSGRPITGNLRRVSPPDGPAVFIRSPAALAGCGERFLRDGGAAHKRNSEVVPTIFARRPSHPQIRVNPPQRSAVVHTSSTGSCGQLGGSGLARWAAQLAHGCTSYPAWTAPNARRGPHRPLRASHRARTGTAPPRPGPSVRRSPRSPRPPPPARRAGRAAPGVRPGCTRGPGSPPDTGASRCLGLPQDRRARQPEHRQRPAPRSTAVACPRRRPPGCRGAVGLQVGDPGAGLLGDHGQQLDLFPDPLGQHGRAGVQVTAPEVLPVAIGHLGADHHPPGGGSGAHRAHGGLVPGVETAGQVGTRDHLEQAVVVGHPLAEVGVEVDPGPVRPAGSRNAWIQSARAQGSHSGVTEKCLRSQVWVQLHEGSGRHYW